MTSLFSADASTEALVAEEAAEDNKQIFPLVKDDTILGYIRTFLYGMQVTSRYVKILANPDYINQLLLLIMGENAIQFDAADFVNKPNVTLYTDNTRYSYASIGATVAEFIAAVNELQAQGKDATSPEFVALRKELTTSFDRSKNLFELVEYKGSADASQQGHLFQG